jgi:hypothetical protein
LSSSTPTAPVGPAWTSFSGWVRPRGAPDRPTCRHGPAFDKQSAASRRARTPACAQAGLQQPCPNVGKAPALLINTAPAPAPASPR